VTWLLVAAAIAVTSLAVGAGLRRWTATFRTLRTQLLVITTTGVVVAAAAAWVLARLMLLPEDQLGPMLGVLALAAVIAGTLVTVATAPMGDAAHELAATVARIEAGDRRVVDHATRGDELGRVAAALDRLTRRLAELEAEQAALDRERTHMLSSISHDLRSPLSALRAALDALVDGVAPDPPRYLRSMQADVAALTALVDDFFLLARIEGGSLDLPLGHVDLSECCDEAVEALTPTAAAKGVTVRLHAADHVQVRGNANALGRVVRNLLDNAIRHAPEGSVVTVTVGRDGRPVVAVADAGPGFAPDFAEHAFDRWSRADESRSRETGGGGLGLAIARGLVAAHGGRIWISPPPGGHVAFEVSPIPVDLA
jgi:two-component system sensor histidine kinase BaeS